MDNFKAKVVSGFAWQAFAKLLVQALSWVSTIWVARLLVPEDYGLVATAGIFTGFLMILASSGVAAALINAKGLERQELDTAYWLSFIIALSLYFALLSVSGYIGRFFHEPELPGLLAFAGLIIVFSALKTVPLVIALRKLEYKEIAFANVIANLFSITTTLTMAHLDYGYWSLVAGTLVAEVVAKVVLMFRYRYFPARAFASSVVKTIFSFSLKLTLNRIFMFFSNNLPVFYLSNSVGTEATGNYQFANSLASMPSKKFGDLFTGLVFPVISRVKDQPGVAKSTFLRMHFYMMATTGPMFMLLFLVAEPLVLFVLTEKWGDAIYPFRMLCIVSLFGLSSLFITRAAEAFNGLSLSVYAQAFTFSGVLLAVAISFYQSAGLNQMILYYVITYPICYLFLAYRVKSLFRLRWQEFVGMYLPLAVALCIMALSYELMKNHFVVAGLNNWSPVVSAAISLLLYFVALFLLSYKTLLPDAKELIRQIKESKNT